MLALLAAHACAHGARGPAVTDSGPVVVSLTAEPLEFSLTDLGSFQVGLRATNQGTAVVDPQLHQVGLLVNGVPSMAWNLAVGNGARLPEWFALPPGREVSMAWPLGTALFPSAGAYDLVLSGPGASSAVLRVNVRP